ncbi:hypothetical protein PCANC_21105 [Puccinia coronata f. sp. avenae]|uniref:Uncharacterized protein n=1 Tax=Puccinia coronata f. sp. avenae TaxID=200324 RepID=A0A2N5UBV0_9BASI|nr:hypothetical protein PCANC_27486 [Puccinia coronata f. sp. avenae]PLW08171.1 hypothetical protein PCASD_24533 [Puccinia coronata f. sp. avenae]PLW29674.1 hypothetical protein PCANC_21105 [Puccinia coronata f. sp. avenae]PLW35213.1 hypothetical protein PCASD_08606 [Puccinia coronata f. sp. avenae]
MSQDMYSLPSSLTSSLLSSIAHRCNLVFHRYSLSSSLTSSLLSSIAHRCNLVFHSCLDELFYTGSFRKGGPR